MWRLPPARGSSRVDVLSTSQWFADAASLQRAASCLTCTETDKSVPGVAPWILVSSFMVILVNDIGRTLTALFGAIWNQTRNASLALVAIAII